MNKKIPVYAWYFPNWHPDSRNDLWHGKNWTEWEGLKHAAPRFPGHKLYHPLWGYADESDPRVMEQKIDAALSHGVEGFFWDFYWFGDGFGADETKGSYRLRALNEGFFGAKNNEKMKIALMWCNHDPIYVHPAAYRDVGRCLLSGKITPQLFHDVTQYMIRHYFWRENYLRVDGKLYFIFWMPERLIEDMGGPDGARMALEDFRARVRRAGLGEMYLAGVSSNLGGTREHANAVCRQLGLDGVVSYSWPIDPEEPERYAWPAYPYETYMRQGIETFQKNTARFDLPVNITVSQGWDSSPRTVPSDQYDPIGYPFSWIVDKKDPAEFERALRAAKAFAQSERFTGDFITLSTWNEWTEGNFLEPSVEDGFAYLEAVKRVFGEE